LRLNDRDAARLQSMGYRVVAVDPEEYQTMRMTRAQMKR